MVWILVRRQILMYLPVLMVIDHGVGLMTLYAHNNTLLVSVVQCVIRGQVIAKVGATGYATGPHIHISVIVNGQFVNPRNYLF